MSENDREKKRKEDAQEERKAGQKAFGEGDYDAAVKHFSNAMELDEEDVSSLIDRVAAYYVIGKYKECIADCIRLEEVASENSHFIALRANFLTTKGLAYKKSAKCAKDYSIAVEALEEAWKFNKFEVVLNELEDARSLKESYEKREGMGDRKRETGNKLRMENDFDGAIAYYTKAIELNPRDTNAYCNRALCYTSKKMLAEGLKDAEKCLVLDPNFVRGYLQKGDIEFQKSKYSKALGTYEMGLKHDTENKELHDAISKSREALKEKQAKAMLDPEIQAILSDPIMRQVLIDFQQNSSDAHDLAKNKLVLQKVQKLLDAEFC